MRRNTSSSNTIHRIVTSATMLAVGIHFMNQQTDDATANYFIPSSFQAFAFSPASSHHDNKYYAKQRHYRHPIEIYNKQIIEIDSTSAPFAFDAPSTKKSPHYSHSQLHLSPISHEPISAILSSPLLTNLFSFTGNVPFLPSFLLNSILFFSLRPKLNTMLTPEGFAHSLALGTMLWMTLGWRGWTVCVVYLFLGQFVTKIGFADKEAMGIAEKRGGRRGPENVWGSALTGVMCASAAAQALKLSSSPLLLSGGDALFLGLSYDVWVLAYVASLATKIADTFASEIGKAYGKTTFLITTLKPVPPGTEGAISLEGTVASVVGGFLLSLYAYVVVGMIPTLEALGVATFAAFVATMVESLIGATLQEKEGLSWMTNEVVNFFNTLIGAAIALVLGSLVLGL